MKRLLLLCLAAAFAVLTGCSSDGTGDETSRFYVVTFEEGTESYLAGPTIAGENLYDTYEGTRVYDYYLSDCDLMLSINGDADNTHNVWNGATFISQWNDMVTEGYVNQCSVYYNDPTTGFGGRNGSKTFGVSYGAPRAGVPESQIYFKTDGAEYVIDHMYVANATYAALTMERGNEYAKKFSYEDADWFKLIVTGYDRNETATGTVEFYLADFRTTSSPGIISEWTRIDLSSLGAVHRLKFDMLSSDIGAYDILNTPAYFCFDDIAIRKE